MNTYLLLAAAMCCVTNFIHCYFGGKYIAAPLLRSRDIHDVAKYTNYFCWHIITLMLAVMALAFVWAAMEPEAIEAAIVAEMLSLSFTAWIVGLVLWKRQSFRSMPQWSLFGAISALGGFGIAG